MTQEERQRAKPILFNTPMVQAIQERRKTVTRRLVKPQPKKPWFGWCTSSTDKSREGAACWGSNAINADEYRKPPYQKGDILYVRETWLNLFEISYIYKADFGHIQEDFYSVKNVYDYRWRPSIHMPKEAARIFLRVTDVRVERLQEITEDGAMDEGVDPTTTPNIPGKGRTYIQGFGELWNSTINKKDIDKYGWYANPWVWVIGFEVMSVRGRGICEE